MSWLVLHSFCSHWWQGQLQSTLWISRWLSTFSRANSRNKTKNVYSCSCFSTKICRQNNFGQLSVDKMPIRQKDCRLKFVDQNSSTKFCRQKCLSTNDVITVNNTLHRCLFSICHYLTIRDELKIYVYWLFILVF